MRKREFSFLSAFRFFILFFTVIFGLITIFGCRSDGDNGTTTDCFNLIYKDAFDSPENWTITALREGYIADGQLYLYAQGTVGNPPGTGSTDVASAILTEDVPTLPRGIYKIEIDFHAFDPVNVAAGQQIEVNGNHIRLSSLERTTNTYYFMVTADSELLELAFVAWSGDDMGMVVPVELSVFEVTVSSFSEEGEDPGCIKEVFIDTFDNPDNYDVISGSIEDGRLHLLADGTDPAIPDIATAVYIKDEPVLTPGNYVLLVEYDLDGDYSNEIEVNGNEQWLSNDQSQESIYFQIELDSELLDLRIGKNTPTTAKMTTDVYEVRILKLY